LLTLLTIYIRYELNRLKANEKKYMKLAIGTVQFGIPYGISNDSGQTNINEIKKILNICKKTNIQLLDTAPAYGQSEKILGKVLGKEPNFKIITKTPYFNSNKITQKDISKLINSINCSLNNLKKNRLYGVLFHNTDDLFCENGEKLLVELNKLKKQKVIQKIGFSVYTKNQINRILDFFDFDIIQLPINILDQNLLLDGSLEKLKKSKIEIHARSIFLQGLLLMPTKNIPNYFKPALNMVNKTLNDLNITPLQAALAFVKNIKYIDYMLVGVNNSKQLIENIDAYNKITKNLNFEKFACFDEKITNPTLWKHIK